MVVLDLLLCHVPSHYFREIGGKGGMCVCVCMRESTSKHNLQSPLKEIESLATVVTF